MPPSMLRRIVSETLASGPRKRQSWFDKLPPHQQAEIMSVVNDWLSGQLVLPRAALARAIMQCADEYGLSAKAESTVEQWLARTQQEHERAKLATPPSPTGGRRGKSPRNRPGGGS